MSLDVDKSVNAISNDKIQSLKLKRKKGILKELIQDIKNPQHDSYERKLRNDIYVYHTECPYAANSGLILESRYIWWKNHPEDEIKYNEIIHHINGDSSDNRIENLCKMRAGTHRKLHGLMARSERDADEYIISRGFDL